MTTLKLTEVQIERRLELMFDAIDAELMAGQLTQDEYELKMKEIGRWAAAQSMGGDTNG